MKLVTATIIMVVLLFGLMAFNTQINSRFYTEAPVHSDVLDAEKQSKLTPSLIIEELKAGNERFVNNDVISFDYRAQVSKSAEAQYPKAAILSCIDSRVPVERVFNKSIGDLFVARVAGNVVNDDILGSLEYATKVAGSKVVVVLGHENCGAVKSAIDNVKLGNITNLLAKINPAIEHSHEFDGEKASKNHTYVNHVSKNNVLKTIEKMKAESPILNEMVNNNELEIVGAIYKMKSGEVVFL